MPPQVAILGRGSLLWDGRLEFDEWHEGWRPDGPVLKLEFSRVSSSRSGALTLVVDEAHGVDTTVAWCLSRRRDIDDAAGDLRRREGTTIASIGCWRADAATEVYSPGQCAEWARARGLDAVVWTKLT